MKGMRFNYNFRVSFSMDFVNETWQLKENKKGFIDFATVVFDSPVSSIFDAIGKN